MTKLSTTIIALLYASVAVSHGVQAQVSRDLFKVERLSESEVEVVPHEGITEEDWDKVPFEEEDAGDEAIEPLAGEGMPSCENYCPVCRCDVPAQHSHLHRASRESTTRIVSKTLL